MPRNPRPVRKDPIIEVATQVQSGLSGAGTPCDDAPEALGTASPGTSTNYSRCDHVHPLEAILGLTGIYGDGADGPLTLSSNTTYAAQDNIKRYTDLDLNGFTLHQDSSDTFLIIYVSGTLTLNNGTIYTDIGNGGSGGSQVNAGTGGTGGNRAGLLMVCAKNIVGTGTIKSSNPGGVGTDSPGGTGNVPRVGGGTATNTGLFYGVGKSASSGGTGGGNSGGSGTGAIGTAAERRMFAILHNWLYINAGADMLSYMNESIAGHGGSSGSTSNPGGGGGGGGGGAFYGAGGAGGDPGAGTAGDTQVGGGGGGAGGSGGGVCIVITDSAPSGLTVSAAGGAGGNGGAGRLAGTTKSGNGGGGGGGGGGLAILVAQPGASSTVTAAGGVAGGKGGYVDGGGFDGTAGGDGIAMKLPV